MLPNRLTRTQMQSLDLNINFFNVTKYEYVPIPTRNFVTYLNRDLVRTTKLTKFGIDLLATYARYY